VQTTDRRVEFLTFANDAPCPVPDAQEGA